MVTPLIMLFIMVLPAAAMKAHSVLIESKGGSVRAAAAVGLGALFVFTGAGHFLQTEAMAQMLPPWVPFRVSLVHATGLLELAIAAGFFVPRYRHLAGLAAAAVLIGFFPANVYAAFVHAPMGGHAWGPVYLFVRAPLQAAILAWVYWFTIKKEA